MGDRSIRRTKVEPREEKSGERREWFIAGMAMIAGTG